MQAKNSNLEEFIVRKAQTLISYLCPNNTDESLLN